MNILIDNQKTFALFVIIFRAESKKMNCFLDGEIFPKHDI